MAFRGFLRLTAISTASSASSRPNVGLVAQPTCQHFAHGPQCGPRGALRLLPPLVLHERDGAKHTPEAEAILRGEAALDWA